MEYFAPGFRAFIRFGTRTRASIQRFFALRALAKAETQLGLLGWQQADFDPDTQRQVDAIHNVEREQAVLTNRAAELSRAIGVLNDERTNARREYEAQRDELSSERSTFAHQRSELDRGLDGLEAREPDLERKSAALDSEEKELDTLYKSLLVIQPQTAQVRDEVLRLRDRLMAIQTVRAELKRQQAQLVESLRTRREEKRGLNEKIADLESRLRVLKSEAETRDGESARQVREREKERAKAQSESDQLERAKHNPYREIGRVLANSHVAPLNQPDALAKVLALRNKVAECEFIAAQSIELGKTENPEMLRISLALWGLLLLVALLIVASLF